MTEHKKTRLEEKKPEKRPSEESQYEDFSVHPHLIFDMTEHIRHRNDRRYEDIIFRNPEEKATRDFTKEMLEYEKRLKESNERIARDEKEMYERLKGRIDSTTLMEEVMEVRVAAARQYYEAMKELQRRFKEGHIF